MANTQQKEDDLRKLKELMARLKAKREAEREAEKAAQQPKG